MSHKGTPNGKIIPFRRPRRTASEPTQSAAPSEAAADAKPSIVTRIVELKKRSDVVRTAMNALPSWITPNGVTIFRTLLIVPIILLIRDAAYLQALCVYGASMLLDFVDGALAHVRGQHSELGAFLDPLGDKIVDCGTLIALLPVLPDIYRIPVAGITLIAASLTLGRIPRMVRRQQGMPQRTVSATSAGKIKTIVEVVSIAVLLGMLAAGITELKPLFVPFGMLVLAMLLGGMSLLSQFMPPKE